MLPALPLLNVGVLTKLPEFPFPELSFQVILEREQLGMISLEMELLEGWLIRYPRQCFTIFGGTAGFLFVLIYNAVR